MSYDIEFKDPNGNLYEVLKPHFGGTYQSGGNTETEINITYNYCWLYYGYMGEKGIRELYGKTGAECIDLLKSVCDMFKYHFTCKNYWKATPGNCVAPLKILLGWCEKWPEGVFSGD